MGCSPMSCLMGLSVASALGIDLGSGLSPPSGAGYRWSQQEVIEGFEALHSSLSGKRGLRGTAVAFPPFPPRPQATLCISHTAPSREGHDTGFQGSFQLDFLVCTTATPSTRWEVRHGRQSNYAVTRVGKGCALRTAARSGCRRCFQPGLGQIPGSPGAGDKLRLSQPGTPQIRFPGHKRSPCHHLQPDQLTQGPQKACNFTHP